MVGGNNRDSLLIISFREKSKSPKPRTKKEAVEEELDETIKALEKQVCLNLTKQQQQPHPSVTTTAGLGSEVVIVMMSNTSLLSPSVTRAAVSVRDAAGAVREVAENILKSLTPERQTQPGFSQQQVEQQVEEEVGEGESEEEEMSGYDDDFSVGIDLPLAVDTTSGNVTPIPTTGELEELRLVPLRSYQHSLTSHSHLQFCRHSRGGGGGPDNHRGGLSATPRLSVNSTQISPEEAELRDGGAEQQQQRL